MWTIKFLEKNKEKKITEEFQTSSEADEYIEKHMSGINEVWVEEELIEPQKKINLEAAKGKWIHFYSNKKKMFFSYGVVKNIEGEFIMIQTKENQIEEDWAIFRQEKIKDLYANKKAEFNNEGEFVKISEYV